MVFIYVVLRLAILRLPKRGCITTMRAPNILIFLLTVILAFVGVWEHIGAPVKIPDFSLPVIGSSKDLIPFLAAHSFWLVVAAWLLLAIGVMLPRRSRQKMGRSLPIAQGAS
jgi:hypothetical protein